MRCHHLDAQSHSPQVRDEGRVHVGLRTWSPTFSRTNSRLFHEMTGCLEEMRIRPILPFSSGFLKVPPELPLILVAICINMLAPSSAQSGFLSIDCGSTQAKYNDSLGLEWVTDTDTYATTGASYEQSYVNWTFVNLTTGLAAGTGMQTLESFRYFPDRRSKHCYELETEPNFPYLIRVSFYMNKPELLVRAPFSFLTYLNATQWFTLTTSRAQLNEDDFYDLLVIQEAIFNSPGQVMNLCLLPVVGEPFISSVELRRLAPSMYSYNDFKFQYLSLLFRYNLGPTSSDVAAVRFPEDSYDRLWGRFPSLLDACNAGLATCVSNSTPQDTTPRADANYVPPKVMQDAWLLYPPFDGFPLLISKNSSTMQAVDLPPIELACVVVYAEDLNSSHLLPSGYYISLNSNFVIGSTPGLVNVSQQTSMLATPSVHMTQSTSIWLDVNALDLSLESSNPMNAAEAYAQYNFNFSTTAETEQRTITLLKGNLSMTDWQGDPCIPVPYDWLACSCTYCDQGAVASLGDEYRVSSLTLSNLPTSLLSFLPHFYTLAALETLSITYSGIDTPTFFGLIDRLFYINYFDFSHNVIDHFPASKFWIAYGFPPVPISINLSHNQIAKLEAFENASCTFPYLDTLDLSHNAITSLPSAMWTWNITNNLKVLDLSHNQIGDISDVDNLVQINSEVLQELNVSHNKLSTGNFFGSLYFSGLPDLTTAIFDGNSIQGVLDLSKWHNALQEAAFENSTKTNVTLQLFSFVNNSITNITPSAEVLEPAMNKLLPSFKKGILLGGNPYCVGATSYIHRYLCRSTYDEIVLQETNREDKGHPNTDILITGIAVGIFGFLMSVLALVSMSKLWKQMSALSKIQNALADQKVQPPFYEYRTLKLATKDFDKERKLGQGGFGIVYMGVLEDNTKLAVKKLFHSQKLQVLNEFLNEVVLITGIKHRNLVQLKGCCIKDKQRMLVYEYAENGNLAQALWGSRPHGGLNWEQRYAICMGVARGLSYLHEELQPSIIHRDIKPENILLEQDFMPKIADFGLARNISEELSGVAYTQNTAGTLGYFSPEYATEGKLSDKVDVYAFGIVVLEVVSGRKCIDSSLPEEKKYLKYWVDDMHQGGSLLDILQPELRDKCVEAEVLRAINIGLLCVQHDPRRRPSMSQVVTMFLGIQDVNIVFKEEARDEALEEAFRAGFRVQFLNDDHHTV